MDLKTSPTKPAILPIQVENFLLSLITRPSIKISEQPPTPSMDVKNAIREIENKVKKQWEERRIFKNLKELKETENGRLAVNLSHERKILRNEEFFEFKYKKINDGIQLLINKQSDLNSRMEVHRKELQDMRVGSDFDTHYKELKQILELGMAMKTEKIQHLITENAILERKKEIMNSFCKCAVIGETDDFTEASETSASETNLSIYTRNKPAMVDASTQTDPVKFFYISEEYDGMLVDVIKDTKKKAHKSKFLEKLRQVYSKCKMGSNGGTLTISSGSNGDIRYCYQEPSQELTAMNTHDTLLQTSQGTSDSSNFTDEERQGRTPTYNFDTQSEN